MRIYAIVDCLNGFLFLFFVLKWFLLNVSYAVLLFYLFDLL